MEEESKVFSKDPKISEPLVNSEDATTVVPKEKEADEVIVDIVNPAPIVVFFGPSKIGKTVTLIRLCRYLKEKKYTIEPDTQFRKDDPIYQKICSEFDDKYMETPLRPDSTAAINFLLIKVKDSKGDVCQLLEAPGEHFFDIKNSKRDYPPYFYRIIHDTKIPKIYVFFLEFAWESVDSRKKYENRIVEFRHNLGNNDSVIVLVNKADTQPALIDKQKPVEKKFKASVKHQYPDIYDTYLDSGILNADHYKSDFAVFSSGHFVEKTRVFTNSIDFYPEQLWAKIKKRLKGSWWGN